MAVLKPSPNTPVGRLWRHRDGRITYFNSAPQHRIALDVTDLPMQATLIGRALVTKRDTTRSNREATMEDPKTTFGAVYDADGTILTEFVERQQWLQDKLSRPADPPVVDQNRKAAARPVEGLSVYLGDLSLHFGHFLLVDVAGMAPQVSRFKPQDYLPSSRRNRFDRAR